MTRNTFITRAMMPDDVPACVAIINHIIAQGHTTAHEDPFDDQLFADHYMDEPETANVVLFENRIVGFQSSFEIEPGVFSIGSFTDQQNPVQGAGKALTDKTKADCRALGGTSIIAKITSDNIGGLAFYSKMGFEDEAVLSGEFTRKDGTVVDRIIKRFVL